MRLLPLVLAGLALAPAAQAQRRFRIGPVVSAVALDEGSATASFTSLGGTIALLSSQDAETGVTVARYADLSTTSCERSLTFVGIDSYYYPLGASGFAPFASTEIGLARVTDEDVGLGFPLSPCVAAEPSNQFGLGFGLGARLNVGGETAAMVEGRFFQVPQSAIQTLEARASISLAFGKPRGGELLAGTVGPAVGVWIPVSGALQARGPLLGVRFRRDSRSAGTVGLHVDYVPLTLEGGCSDPCDPDPFAILFAPGYETGLHAPWGRLYGTLGVLLAGFPAEGPDRGMTQGAQGGLGADVFAGERWMVNLTARLVWLQRASRDNVFVVQVGGAVSPKLVHRRGQLNP